MSKYQYYELGRCGRFQEAFSALIERHQKKGIFLQRLQKAGIDGAGRIDDDAGR